MTTPRKPAPPEDRPTAAYRQAEAYLRASYGQNSKKGMDMMRRALSLLGDPHKRLRVIHVAGTNGKGSTCAMLSSVLQAAGYRVGMFTSPHLIRFNERIAIDGTPIDDGAFAFWAGRVREVSLALFQNEAEHFSFFEILTLMAFSYFEAQRVDFALIEVGIGGLEDCTNVIPPPLLAVITAIGYDHMEHLGHTLEGIAAQKAGIVKNFSKTVLYLADGTVYNTVKKVCLEKNNTLYYLLPEQGTDEPCPPVDRFVDVRRQDIDGTVFDVALPGMYGAPAERYAGLRLPLLGQYQVYNALHALLCVRALRDLGVAIPEAAVRQGLARVRWPGRMDLLSRRPAVIADGAHNPDGAAQFAKAAALYAKGRNSIVVVGVIKDKAYREMLPHFVGQAGAVIATQPPETPRALPAGELYAYLQTFYRGRLAFTPDGAEALRMAYAWAGPEDIIFVTGSLYLIGQIEACFKQAEQAGGRGYDRF